ncbi:MAG: NrdH-redoxin [Rhodospirillaceae bacterium]|jgi:glutaredoxin|nr:NrdH-redoxin [Rhodospirillaceae bacterium]MBT5241185.1 NrdH-redoxin [Rhodospirillaceae bacterium]MBT5565180.1 NrdH-redoxin [Rhodospirillaceae bacterium]MBT6088202.1 NrdH-redoxin [Rhodospirillaceae bacterium]MBT7452089.1 NrdH-redoxin [Rhodospirillaceae bacterium]
MSQSFRVFWQPGCSSCLKAKEFLAEHGIAFDSVNVLADEGGLAALQALGAQSVPVVSQGNNFVFAQNLGDLADFVGVARIGGALSVAELVERIDRVLAVAQSHAGQLPLDVLNTKLPGRDRTYLDLGYHVFVIAEAFLVAANGGTLTFDLFERRPPGSIADGDQVASYGQTVRDAFREWWQSTDSGAILPDHLDTYYGAQSTPDLLERTAWHSAQHTRQLAEVLRNLNIVLDDELTNNDLRGLPLPNHVYDDEVSLAAETPND